jgi:hypothetical protein
MQHARHHYKHPPIDFLITNWVRKDHTSGGKKTRLKAFYFPEFFAQHRKKAKGDQRWQKRHALLPLLEDNEASHLYFQNRINLRYIVYFQDQLHYLSILVRKCLYVPSSIMIEQKLQMMHKQFTFLHLQTERIKADLQTNHHVLKEAVAERSGEALNEIAKEEARINFDVKVFLSKLGTTKKGAIPLLKKMAGELLHGEKILLNNE